MDFKQLEAYVRVFELRSFSKAAEVIYLSQPSVSSYISALEKELKTQLIFRSTKEFSPTKAGVMFYEYARDMLALRDKSITSIQHFSDHTVGNIDVLASSVPAQYILPEILGAFHELYPNITFHLEQMDTMEVVKGISSNKGEVGFVGAKIENIKCVYQEFMSEKMVIIAPLAERFSMIDPDNIHDLFYHEYFIMRELGSGTRMRYEELMKEIGVKPDKLKISAYFNNTQSIILAVAHGLGISIVSEIAARYYIKQKMVMPVAINYPLPERKFYLVMKNNYTAVPAVVNTLIDFTRSYTKSFP